MVSARHGGVPEPDLQCGAVDRDDAELAVRQVGKRCSERFRHGAARGSSTGRRRPSATEEQDGDGQVELALSGYDGPLPPCGVAEPGGIRLRWEEHKAELPSLFRISYTGFCVKQKNK